VHVHFARVGVVNDRVLEQQRVNVLSGLRFGLGQRLVVPLQRRAVPRTLLNHQNFINSIFEFKRWTFAQEIDAINFKELAVWLVYLFEPSCWVYEV
jgi:hypothetical protein